MKCFNIWFFRTFCCWWRQQVRNLIFNVVKCCVFLFVCFLLQTETLVLRTERRALCDCMPTNSLRWAPEDTSRSNDAPTHFKNNSVQNLCSCTAALIFAYSHNRHFILFSLMSLFSEALIWSHEACFRSALSGMTFIPLTFYMVYQTPVNLDCFHWQPLSCVSYKA